MSRVRNACRRVVSELLARVDQKNGEIGSGCARYHIASVLLVPRSIGDDEFAPSRREKR